jgi:hypothetical protein
MEHQEVTASEQGGQLEKKGGHITPRQGILRQSQREVAALLIDLDQPLKAPVGLQVDIKVRVEP